MFDFCYGLFYMPFWFSWEIVLCLVSVVATMELKGPLRLSAITCLVNSEDSLQRSISFLGALRAGASGFESSSSAGGAQGLENCLFRDIYAFVFKKK